MAPRKKSEFRNPKSETNPKLEKDRKSGANRKSALWYSAPRSGIRISPFRICFELSNCRPEASVRVSDFGFPGEVPGSGFAGLGEDRRTGMRQSDLPATDPCRTLRRVRCPWCRPRRWPARCSRPAAGATIAAASLLFVGSANAYVCANAALQRRRAAPTVVGRHREILAQRDHLELRIGQHAGTLYGATPSVGPTARISSCFGPSPVMIKPDVRTFSPGPVKPSVERLTNCTGEVASSRSYTSASAMPAVAAPLGTIRTV